MTTKKNKRDGTLLTRFWADTIQHFTAWDKWMALLLSLSFSGALISHFSTDLYRFRAIWFVLVLVFFVLMMFRPMVQLGVQRHKKLAQLTSWAVIGFLLLLITLTAAFFALPDMLPSMTDDKAARYDRILYIPPILAAIWAAGFGWFVSYQATMKTQRTAHAVALTMQLMSNSEIQSRFEKFRRVFAPEDSIEPGVYGAYFPARRVQDLPILRLRFDAETETDKKRLLIQEIAKIEAIDALRSILNQYEFMAVGIMQGDLDEDILYETVSTNVRSIWKRTEGYRKYVNANREVLAWTSLADLTADWNLRLADEENEIKKRNGG